MGRYSIVRYSTVLYSTLQYNTVYVGPYSSKFMIDTTLCHEIMSFNHDIIDNNNKRDCVHNI